MIKKLFILGLFALNLSRQARAEELLLITDVAHQVAISKDGLGPDGWRSYVQNFNGKYETWANDTGGSRSRYLDDRLVELGPRAHSGDIAALKELTYWIALYPEFGEAPHSALIKLSRDNQKQIHDLSTDFSWEKLQQVVRSSGPTGKLRLPVRKYLKV